jgi:hypothetical protein
LRPEGEPLGKSGNMGEFAVQIMVADVRDGACSSSTPKEASSWDKVETVYGQMVFAETTGVSPLIASYVYHMRGWEVRFEREWSRIFEPMSKSILSEQRNEREQNGREIRVGKGITGGYKRS